MLVNFIHVRDGITNYWRKIHSVVLGILSIHLEKIKLDCTIHKNKIRLIENLHVKSITLKLFKENVGKYLHDLEHTQ